MAKPAARLVVVAAAVLSVAAVGAAGPTPGLPAKLRAMGQARHALMFRYLSEEALSLIASPVASRGVTA